MRSFHTTYSMANTYGPGDEETWGPYSGHHMDPRQPAEDDEIVREEARLEIIEDRIKDDVAWLTEAIEDADDATLQSFVSGYVADDWQTVRVAITKILEYAAPTEEEITDLIRSK